MTAYYNEIDPYVAQWLRNLIAAGHIAPGEVDERSIVDVQPDDLKGFTQCHFFAGIGGWSYAARLAGWPDDRELWTGSCPCQPFSVAGNGAGFEDDRHLWPYLKNLIKERCPSAFFGEQSAAAIAWLKLVRSDLEAMGRAVGIILIEAACKGARHKRDRAWVSSHAERNEQPRQEPRSGTAGRVGRIIEPFPWDEPWESALSRFRIVGDGLPRSVGATDAARNAIVPQIAAEVIGAYLDMERAVA
jgi:DNA (cytosine-5)-methyltransferase 1